MTHKKAHIVFHHIPKCGGMSISAGLAASYFPVRLLTEGRRGFPGTLDARAASEAAERTSEEKYAFRRRLLAYHVARGDSPLIAGHYPFCPIVHSEYAGQWNFVTLLRDPVKRWYSEYYWNRYKNHDYARTEATIEEYIGSPQGRRDARSFVNFLAQAEDPQGDVSSAELSEALSALPKFDVLGVLEDLDGFRGLLKEKMGRRPWFPKRNRSPAPTEARKPPDEQSDFHRELLRMLGPDLEIYEKALEVISSGRSASSCA